MAFAMHEEVRHSLILSVPQMQRARHWQESQLFGSWTLPVATCSPYKVYRRLSKEDYSGCCGWA